MNRNDRRTLRRAAERYLSRTQSAVDDFRCVVENLKTSEEEKLDNLPESLQEGPQAENIESSIEMMEDVLENIGTVEEACDEMADTLEVKRDPIEHPYRSSESITNDPRDQRFQILLTKHLLDELKRTSAETGLSCNEIIFRAISKELSSHTN